MEFFHAAADRRDAGRLRTGIARRVKRRSACCGLLLLFYLLPAFVTPFQEVRSQSAQPVGLELALLVDVSASVSDEEFRLQSIGLATALRSEPVIEAIQQVAPQGVALAVVQWGNEATQSLAVEWTLLRGRADALAMAARIEAMQRLVDGGHTAISNALLFGMQELETNGFAGLRRVIDLSGDGRNNDGFLLNSSREEVLSRGITINGLAIINELPLLDRYFRDYLIGGEDAFYVVADDYSDFARAMTQKLVREISSAPVS